MTCFDELLAVLAHRFLVLFTFSRAYQGLYRDGSDNNGSIKRLLALASDIGRSRMGHAHQKYTDTILCFSRNKWPLGCNPQYHCVMTQCTVMPLYFSAVVCYFLKSSILLHWNTRILPCDASHTKITGFTSLTFPLCHNQRISCRYQAQISSK